MSRTHSRSLTGNGAMDAMTVKRARAADSVFSCATPRAVVMSQARAAIGWHGPTRLRSLDVPCTVVHGAADPLTPAENSRRIMRLIRGSELVELPGVGHLVPQEAPDELAEIVMERSGRSS